MTTYIIYGIVSCTGTFLFWSANIDFWCFTRSLVSFTPNINITDLTFLICFGNDHLGEFWWLFKWLIGYFIIVFFHYTFFKSYTYENVCVVCPHSYLILVRINNDIFVYWYCHIQKKLKTKTRSRQKNTDYKGIEQDFNNSNLSITNDSNSKIILLICILVILPMLVEI